MKVLSVDLKASRLPTGSRGLSLKWPGRLLRSVLASWVDIAWVLFAGLNLLAMQISPPWQTVPFLIIWVSLTALYGFRLWRLGSTIVTVAIVTLATGGLISVQVLRGQEDAEYLVEVPLVAVMFVVMAWHAQRRQTAMAEMKRVSEHNLRLLDRQSRFLQDAAHELRTPITVALGHTELIQRAAADPAIAQDARVATDELLRLRRLASRLLLLASADGPDFLRVAPVEIGDLVLDAFGRWSHTPRRWSLGDLAEATVQGDRDRLVLALDALIENAVHHTRQDGRIALSVRREDSNVVVVVADSGPGIPAPEVERIFDRFSRVDAARGRATGGSGLGLAIVRAIAEAHGGSARVRSNLGRGSAFELVLPESPVGANGAGGPSPELSTLADTRPSADLVGEQPAGPNASPSPPPAATPGPPGSPSG
jgi:signal transduction histidine kinase